jgi:hypothetical protein
MEPFYLAPSRKDDLESWFYSMIFMLKGRLPWGSFKVGNNKEFVNMKRSVTH